MRILIPTDFSELSKVAIQYAIDFGSELELELILLHVVDTSKSGRARVRSQKLEEIIKADAESEMKRLVASIKKDTNHAINISYELLAGSYIEKEVEDFAKEYNIDMICIGTKGATGLKKALYGSNAAKMIENSSIAVLTVPELAKYQGIHNVVYSSDLCDLNEEVALIMPFIKLTNSRLQVLHIDKDDGSFKGDIKPVEEGLQRNFTYDKIKLTRVKYNTIEDGINGFVDVVKADMVIMFTHHTNFLEKVFMRSTSQKTAFQTKIPLLTFQKEK
ncbi:MAG: universal stress protein [Gilvibacter sp.]